MLCIYGKSGSCFVQSDLLRRQSAVLFTCGEAKQRLEECPLCINPTIICAHGVSLPFGSPFLIKAEDFATKKVHPRLALIMCSVLA